MFALLKPTFSLPLRPLQVVRMQAVRSPNDVFLQTTSSELESKWLQVYDSLKFELTHDPSFEFDDHSRRWVEQMLDYNVPGGKMNRGVSVVDSYKLLKGDELTDDEFFLASVLGWSAEWGACALLMFGENLDDHVQAKDVLVEMGIYYQVQENYGRKDPTSVAKVKELYNTLNLQGVFEDYENKTHEKLIKSIECHPSKAVQAVLKSFLRKIYKRHK